jgi:hypothetical protein
MSTSRQLPLRLSELLRSRKDIGRTEIVRAGAGRIGYTNVGENCNKILFDGEYTIDSTQENVLIALLDNAIVTVTGNISPTTKFLIFDKSELHFPAALSESIENAVINQKIEIYDKAKLVTKAFTATCTFSDQSVLTSTVSGNARPFGSSTASIESVIGRVKGCTIGHLTDDQIIALCNSSDDLPELSERDVTGSKKLCEEIVEAMIEDMQSRSMGFRS